MSYKQYGAFSTYGKTETIKSKFDKKARILLSNDIFVNGSQIILAIVGTIGVML